jgi:hypothetical protein
MISKIKKLYALKVQKFGSQIVTLFAVGTMVIIFITLAIALAWDIFILGHQSAACHLLAGLPCQQQYKL